MISSHCLWAKLNNRTRGQFECDLTWFCFCFDFFRSHTLYGCCTLICLRFQVVQIKQVDFKLSTLMCLNVGMEGVGGGACQISIFGKKPSSSFNYYKSMT